MIKKLLSRAPKVHVTGYHNMRWQRNLIAIFSFVVMALLALSINSNNHVAEAFATQPAFLLRLDTKTGLTEVTQSVVSPTMEIAEEELYLQNSLMNYLVRRERYHAHTFEHDQEFVQVYSEGQALESYFDAISPNNPESYTSNLKDEGYVDAVVLNIVKLNPGEYHINWQMKLFRRQSATPEIYPVKTIVKLKPFAETEIPSKKKHRLLNPFGMKITRYKNQRETL